MSHPETIDITPTWRGILPILVAALTHGTPEGQTSATRELERMADALDAAIARKGLAPPAPPAPPVESTDERIANCERYDKEIMDRELCVIADDYENLIGFIRGYRYEAPSEKGR